MSRKHNNAKGTVEFKGLAKYAPVYDQEIKAPYVTGEQIECMAVYVEMMSHNLDDVALEWSAGSKARAAQEALREAARRLRQLREWRGV